MEPINYTAMQVQPDLVGGLARGLSLGAAYQQMQAQKEAQAQQRQDFAHVQQQRQLAAQQAEQLKARQMQYGQDLQDAMNSGNPSAMLDLSIRYPEQGENLRNYWKAKSGEQRDSEFNASMQALYAIKSGKPDAAIGMIDQQIEAAKNRGIDTAKLESLKTGVQANPKMAGQYLSAFMASVAPEKFAEGLKQFGEASTEEAARPYKVGETAAKAKEAVVTAEYAEIKAKMDVAKTRAEIQNVQSQIQNRIDELKLMRDTLDRGGIIELMKLRADQKKLQSENAKPTAATEKIVNDSIQQASDNRAKSTEYVRLADGIQKLGGGYGRVGDLGSWLQKAYGAETTYEQIRDKWDAERVAIGLSNLPPGPATDKDVKIALGPVPGRNADANTVANYLRAKSKALQYAAENNEIKAGWAGENNSLGRAKRDIEVNGILVPAGTSFADFQSHYFANKAKIDERKGRQQQIQSGGASYMQPNQDNSRPVKDPYSMNALVPD